TNVRLQGLCARDVSAPGRKVKSIHAILRRLVIRFGISILRSDFELTVPKPQAQKASRRIRYNLLPAPARDTRRRHKPKPRRSESRVAPDARVFGAWRQARPHTASRCP